MAAVAVACFALDLLDAAVRTGLDEETGMFRLRFAADRRELGLRLLNTLALYDTAA